MAIFQVAKQNYANARQKSESPNACYSPLNGISHAGHITRGWDLQRKGIFKSEFNHSKHTCQVMSEGASEMRDYSKLQNEDSNKKNQLFLTVQNISLDDADP